MILYGSEFGVFFNVKKTNCFVINDTELDKISIQIDSVKKNYSHIYSYLEAWFTDWGQMRDVVTYMK